MGCLAGRSALATVLYPTCELCRFVDKLSYMLFDLCSPSLYDLFQFMCNIPCVSSFLYLCARSCPAYALNGRAADVTNMSSQALLSPHHHTFGLLPSSCSSRADADDGPPRYANIYVPPRPCLRQKRLVSKLNSSCISSNNGR
jgi:hypothetical protein